METTNKSYEEMIKLIYLRKEGTDLSLIYGETKAFRIIIEMTMERFFLDMTLCLMEVFRCFRVLSLKFYHSTRCHIQGAFGFN